MEEQANEARGKEEEAPATNPESQEATPDKPKQKPAGAMGMMGMLNLGAQVAQMQKNKYDAKSAEQRGELAEQEGKAKEVEELKPEPAPQKGTSRPPAMGFGMIDMSKVALKKTKENN